ncbi:hypothetical protein LNP74_24520 [Klebsiella pneumoniae subsp. pneumoniae]|nr:hypothetical protein [Klebsiella pneumoniae subsp. pneumoniae]
MLLEKLGLPFECAAPDVDETPGLMNPHVSLSPGWRSRPKRSSPSLATRFPNHLITGSDQVCVLDGQKSPGKTAHRGKCRPQAVKQCQSGVNRYLLYRPLALCTTLLSGQRVML